MVALAVVLAPADAFADALAPHSEPLEPGGRLVVVEDHRVPLVRVELSLPVGSSAAWWQDLHLDTVWSLVACNAEGPERSDLVDFVPWVRDHRAGWTALMMPGDAEEAMVSLVDCLQGVFPAGRFWDKAAQRNAWDAGRHSPSVQQSRAVARLFFDPDDVRYGVTRRPGGVAMTAPRMAEIREGLLSLDGWTLGFAGDIEIERAQELAAMLARVLPHRRAQDPWWAQPDTLPLLSPALGAAPVSIEVEATMEALLVWARSGLSLDDEAVPAALLAETVVLRRLRRALRDERGDTYALMSDGLVALAPSPYTLRVPMAPESVLEQVAVVEAELARVATEGLSADEVDRARALIHAGLQGADDAPAEALWLAVDPLAARSLELRGLCATVSLTEVERFARAYFAPERFVRVQVLPKPE